MFQANKHMETLVLWFKEKRNEACSRIKALTTWRLIFKSNLFRIYYDSPSSNVSFIMNTNTNSHCSFLLLQWQQRQIANNRKDKLYLQNQGKPLQSSSMNVQDHSNQQGSQTRPKPGSFAHPLECHTVCCSDFQRGKRSSEVHTITIKSTPCLHLSLTAAAAFSFHWSQRAVLAISIGKVRTLKKWSNHL